MNRCPGRSGKWAESLRYPRMGNTFAMQRLGRLQRRFSGETEQSWSVLSSTKLTRTFNSASDDQVAPYSQRVVAFYFDALLVSVVIANDKVLCLVAMYRNKTRLLFGCKEPPC